MSDLMFGYAQMLAVVVIVGGVALALLQVWELASKLCQSRDREATVTPADSDLHAIERAARERILLKASSRARGAHPDGR